MYRDIMARLSKSFKYYERATLHYGRRGQNAIGEGGVS